MDPERGSTGVSSERRVWVQVRTAQFLQTPSGIFGQNNSGCPPPLKCLWELFKGQGCVMWQDTCRPTSRGGRFSRWASDSQSLRNRLRDLCCSWDYPRMSHTSQVALGPSALQSESLPAPHGGQNCGHRYNKPLYCPPLVTTSPIHPVVHPPICPSIPSSSSLSHSSTALSILFFSFNKCLGTLGSISRIFPGSKKPSSWFGKNETQALMDELELWQAEMG